MPTSSTQTGAASLCPQVFKCCPAFCGSEKCHTGGLLAFAEFRMLIWCPGIISVPVPWWFVWGFHGLSLLSALADVLHSCEVVLESCWPFSSFMWVHSWDLGDCPQELPPSRISSRVILRLKQLPTNSPGALELAQGEQPGWCWLQGRRHQGAKRLCWFCDCLDGLLSHPQRVCDSCDTLKCTDFSQAHTEWVGLGGFCCRWSSRWVFKGFCTSGGDFCKALWLCCVTQGQPGLALIQHTAELQLNKLSWAPLFLKGRSKSCSV